MSLIFIISLQLKIKTNKNKICMVDSLIPGSEQVVSFDHKGICKKSNYSITLTGAIAKVIPRIFTTAGINPIIMKEDNSAQFDQHNNVILHYQSQAHESDFNFSVPVSQIPGYNAFTVKNNLAKNLNNYERQTGVKISPKSYFLPEQYKQLLADSHQYSGYYIVKPSRSSRGRSIYLTKNVTELQYVSDSVVQEYLHNPLLINGYKFDLRVYVLITSTSPLLAYVYPEGLVRFASQKYQTPTEENKNDLKTHLTNFAINSENHQIAQLDGQLGKWKISEFVSYLNVNNSFGLNNNAQTIIQSKINYCIQNALLACQNELSRFKHIKNAFGLYGADIIFDTELNAKLLEINLQPALGTSTPLDLDVKEKMLIEQFNLVGIRIPSTKSNASKQNLNVENKFNLQMMDEESRIGKWIRVLPESDVKMN
ncbi:Tubulin_tyrosine ligase [Hexamita inflata]|uniref:Tubulin--tyrosine ligase-like protein 5 n=1 Tax=Hexamita inflata TaxID=28002 RepID=A0ABP1HGX7_9EUKA